MTTKRRHILGFWAGAALLPQHLLAQDIPLWTESDLRQALALRDATPTDNLAYQLVDSLVTEVGSRPAGSAADPRAVEWALAKLKALGFSNVRADPVAVKAWRAGPVSVDITAPFAHRLVATALGNSVGTPAGGLEAEMAYYPDLASLKADTSDRAKSRIVFINQKTERSRDGSGYGGAVMARVAGAVEAARRGAVAVAIRSIGTDRDRLAHTGGMRYDTQLRQVPALAVSVPDADLIERLQRYGRPVVMRLNVQTETGLDATSHNVIAEVPGTDLSDEIVLLGAHLDSWHVGQGAIDDGVGVGIVCAAAKRLLDGGKPLRRTVRVVLFANEENGLSGATAYADQYKAVRHQLVGESDFGAGKVWRMRSKVHGDAVPALQQMARWLAPLGIEAGDNNGSPAPDAGVMVRRNQWPGIELTQDGTDYFDWHHTDNDTLDKINPDTLPQNVAAWSVVAWLASQSSQRFGQSPAA
ncbi:M28 family peptidase [Rhodoferax sp. AJA081-3]|uniref:M28 family peptidase n=1 Tax=Rhodoferax sp. AJA081-3 TaxID=2752316 RepID=UPI001AE07DC2|nr:M28 family peptidase [Rhodoferax sp. AJA081-3]QTN27554.1 M28 family peptidase [Rhodoferax sp. AJA081-3]